jgi:hypothetical protein
MEHIKHSVGRVVKCAKTKFYENNADLFLKYFKSPAEYQRLINKGAFKEIQEIIKAESDFSFDDFKKTT